LSAFDTSDKDRRAREESVNNLEAFGYRARDYQDDEGFIGASTPEARTQLESLLEGLSDWIYGEGSEASKEVLEEKLKSLHAIADPVLKRIEEAKQRPEKIEFLKAGLERTKMLMTSIKESIESAAASSSSAAAEASKKSAESSAAPTPSPSGDDQLADLEEDIPSSASEEPAPTDIPSFTPYDQEDLDYITKTYNEIDKWLTEKLAAQEKIKPYEDAAFTLTELEGKAEKLGSIMMEIMSKKLNIPGSKSKAKPKSKTKSKTKSTKSKSKKSKGAKSSSSSADESTKTDEPLNQGAKVVGADGKETNMPTQEELQRMIEEQLAKDRAEDEAAKKKSPGHNEL
jgi:hypoxia up-regulated 1